jgi:hypothetical protein
MVIRAITSGPLAALAFAAGCGRIGFDPSAGSDWVFVDETQAIFDLGSYDSGAAPLAWRDGAIQLATPPFDPAAVGYYVSRPLDTGGEAAVWNTLAWVPTAPSGRPLPDDGARDVGYVDGVVDMAEATLLLHLDGTGSGADGSVVPDRSGRAHDGLVQLAGQGVRYIPGVFGQALDIDRDAWVTLDGRYFDFGTGGITYAIWIKNFDCAQSNDNRVAMGGGGLNDRPHTWLGAGCPDPCSGLDSANVNFLDDSRNGTNVEPCTGVVLEDGGWHHLVGVKDGHTAPPAVIRLYVDGREVGATSYDFGANTFTYAGGELRLGGFNLGGTQYNTRIVVDEAAIWKRALSAAEVEALYRRASVRLELQIRVCADGTCDDEAFVGPDGTSATAFTEADLIGAAGAQQDNLGPLGLVGRLAQYRVRFSTEVSTVSPGLRRVEVRATR